RGERVAAASRTPGGPPFFRELGIEPILCDITDAASIEHLCSAVTVRFLAGAELNTVLFAVGWDRASGHSMRAVYVEGLGNVLRALPKPKTFIYVSSTSVYGQSDGSWVSEDSPTEPQEESGRIVLAAERTLHALRPEAVILRFAGIYGPGRLLRQKTVADGEPIVGDPDKWLNLIHAEDGARAVLAAEERGAPGRIYNIADGQPVRRREFFAALAQTLSAPAPQFVEPATDQPPPHEKGNRRIRNQRMRDELHVTLQYETYEDGLKG
ncbi:MAG: NAD-dependent epimerase/dehydratase family protein, partial [Gemmataceae bacterium]|nr:NAD-dependent epimerase/dehydratase family protein [Gemmataceae bacterium]